MICFFYCTETIKVSHIDQGTTYEHLFEQIPNQDRTNIPLDKIYFTTPSDFHNQMENIKKQIGERDDLVYIVDPKKIVGLDGFPKDIGFGKLEESVAHLKGKPEVKIAIINAMSNAVGDHLIGMQAFDYWLECLSGILSGSDVKVSFFQLNPFRVGSITKQWENKIDNIYMLPHKLPKLGDFDAFIDLGTILLREGFDTEHMIDFFFKALSIDPTSVPPEKKRMKYQVPEATNNGIRTIFQTIRRSGHPILLFHRTSTALVRDMTPAKAREVIAEIIRKTDYFVVSADGLDYQNKRFIDISPFSRTIDDFAAIISNCDGIITVDTSTYHLADAFDIPTVVLFTTIDPDLRIRYYPHTKGIMLEKKDGLIFGKHKASKDVEEMKKEVAYLNELWSQLSVDQVLDALQSIKEAS